MQILHQGNYKDFIKRYDFENAELQKIEIFQATTIQLQFLAQDKQNDYNWVKITFLFENILDAKLVDDAKFKFLDFSNGITLLYEKDVFGFAIDKYEYLSGMKNALFYIIAKNLKVESFFIN